jgi:hypothetical protein
MSPDALDERIYDANGTLRLIIAFLISAHREPFTVQSDMFTWLQIATSRHWNHRQMNRIPLFFTGMDHPQRLKGVCGNRSFIC